MPPAENDPLDFARFPDEVLARAADPFLKLDERVKELEAWQKAFMGVLRCMAELDPHCSTAYTARPLAMRLTEIFDAREEILAARKARDAE